MITNDDILFLKSGHRRLQILRAVSHCDGFPVSAHDLVIVFNDIDDVSQMSSLLKELLQKEFITDISNSQRNKQFILTDKGKEVLQTMDEFYDKLSQIKVKK